MIANTTTELARRLLATYDMRKRSGYQNQIIAAREEIRRLFGMGVRQLREELRRTDDSG